MFTGKTYLIATSLDEAYDTLQKHKINTIVGGCGWLKMTHRRIWTAIDLTRLGLDQITETAETVEIGACVSLRQLETHPVLKQLWGGILPRSVEHIVGVQFRNTATVGASVFMRAGFSDLLTALLALDVTVFLHHGGAVPLEEFMGQPFKKDILTGISICKDGRKAAYIAMRRTATDFPVLAAAVSQGEHGWTVSVGARPARAARAHGAAQLLGEGKLAEAAQAASHELRYSGNMRGSEAYRRTLAGVLVRRAAQTLLQEENKA